MRWIKPLFIVLIMSLVGTVAFAQKSEREILVATPFEKATRTYARGDYMEARAHSHEACLHGEEKGCALLADLYRRGFGGPQDLTRAATYYRQSCDGGHAPSCSTLAWLYHRGSGVDQDYIKARTLYVQGCEGGDVSACAAYGNMAYAGLGGVKDTDEGKIYLRQACRDDYEWACNRLWQYGLKP